MKFKNYKNWHKPLCEKFGRPFAYYVQKKDNERVLRVIGKRYGYRYCTLIGNSLTYVRIKKLSLWDGKKRKVRGEE